MTRGFAGQALGLAGWLAAAFATGALGARASVDAAGFYAQLAKPAWAPPAWLFGPVWTLLFVLMGIAAWLVWRRSGWAGARGALALFIGQLVLNAAWSWLFFAWRLGAWALADVLLLAVAVAATAWAFRSHARGAAALLLPYLAWVGFAAVLTFTLWRMNPTLLG